MRFKEFFTTHTFIAFVIATVGLSAYYTATTTSSYKRALPLIHREMKEHMQNTITNTTKSKPKRIAYIMSSDAPPIRKIVSGVTAILKQSGLPFRSKNYYYNGDRQLLRTQIEDAISRNHDALYTLGALASKTALEVSQRRKSSIPIIFSNVLDPVGLGIAQTKEFTGHNMTGLSVNLRDYREQVAAYLSIKPTCKNVLIIYNPSHACTEQNAQEVSQAFRAHNITVKTIEIFSTTEVIEKSKAAILSKEFDTVHILRDPPVMACVDTLVLLCERVGATLFASDDQSVTKGAAVGYSSKEYELGLLAGEQILSVLRDNSSAAHLPIINIDERTMCRLHVNPAHLHAQSITQQLYQILIGKYRADIVTGTE